MFCCSHSFESKEERVLEEEEGWQTAMTLHPLANFLDPLPNLAKWLPLFFSDTEQLHFLVHHHSICRHQVWTNKSGFSRTLQNISQLRNKAAFGYVFSSACWVQIRLTYSMWPWCVMMTKKVLCSVYTRTDRTEVPKLTFISIFTSWTFKNILLLLLAYWP